MRRMLLVVLVTMVAMALHGPTALAQDDDDGYDDDNGVATPAGTATATATPTATATATVDDDDNGVVDDDDAAALPRTGGASFLGPVAGLLLLGSGALALLTLRRNL